MERLLQSGLGEDPLAVLAAVDLSSGIGTGDRPTGADDHKPGRSQSGGEAIDEKVKLVHVFSFVMGFHQS